MSAALDRPALRVELGGVPLPPALGRALTHVLVRQALGAPAAAELDFAEPDAALAAALRPGAALRLRPGDDDTLFEGTVAAIEHDHDGAGGHVMRVRAYDGLEALRRRRRLRALPETSAESLARDLAAELGLALAVSGAAPRRALVVQAGESDLDLLGRLAAAAGLYLVLRDGTLHLLALDGAGAPVPLRLGRELLAARVRVTAEGALGTAEALAWDPATLDTVRRTVAVARQDVEELRGPAGAPLGDAPLPGRPADGAAEAEALAQAAMDRAAAAAATLHGTCLGDPAIAPGRPVVVRGTAGDGDGRYVVTVAIHRFAATTGYTTEFDTAPPDPVPPRPPLLTPAVVTATDDPEGFGRCRARLPTYGDVETGWLQVLLTGAGASKGLVALPEPGDTVLLACLDGDPARGIVLGGLYGRQSLPRGLGGRRRRPVVLRGPAGAALELAGESALARLSTTAGSLVELAPNRLRIAAATDLLIEAPGRTITIRGAAIRFEQG